ncbi:MAG: cell division transport system permease protein [Frankiales bacterium]|nr:cell division transport system permease protein [Frankiales bacterium]
MRAQFIFSEIGIGLRRNLTMTIAVVVTMTISLTLVGIGLLARSQVNVMKGYWYDKVEVTVYLCGANSTSGNCAGKDVTQEQRIGIGNDLRSNPQVKEVFYESKDDAYKRFKEQFKESPDLVDNVSPDALPESYRVKLKDPKKFDEIASAFQDAPGVDSVQDLKKLLDPVFKVLGVFQRFALYVAGFQLLAAVLLISNTIRVAAFSRRRETGIMRLVGASNLYIQLPFLLEGALAGLLGATLASVFLAVGKWGLIDKQLVPLLKFTNFIGWDAVFGVIPWLLITGVLLSSAASFFTLRRHLRV